LKLDSMSGIFSESSCLMEALLLSNQSWCFLMEKPSKTVAASIKHLLRSVHSAVSASVSLWTRGSVSGRLCNLAKIYSRSRSTLRGSSQAMTSSRFFGCRLRTGGRMLNWMDERTRRWSVQHSAPRIARVRCTLRQSERRTMT